MSASDTGVGRARRRPNKGPVTLARLERALLVAAYIVERHGPEYVPIFERLEREVEAVKRASAVVDRARQLLDVGKVSRGPAPRLMIAGQPKS